MNLRKRRTMHAAVEAGSLSDILFFLMLFFLIVSTLASPNAIKLLLPKASTGQTVPRQVINLSIDANLKVYLDKEEIQQSMVQDELKTVAAKYENPTVVLRSDKSVTVEQLVAVIDAVNKAKIPMVIAVDKGQ